MGQYTHKSEQKTVNVDGKKETVLFLSNEYFEQFNTDVLGLGNISQRSKSIEAIAAIYDLSGFTNFCSQVDPQLAVPRYLSSFLDWLFKEIRDKSGVRSFKDGVELYSDLPFLAKFTGDGVLFLWDTDGMDKIAVCNVVGILNTIRRIYKEEFYPTIRKSVVDPPPILRCGVAQGRVLSVGNGQDYVGPCINIASRLQKLGSLTFSFSIKGFDMDSFNVTITKQFIIKKVTLRGIGTYELIGVLKDELDALDKEERAQFKEP